MYRRIISTLLLACLMISLWCGIACADPQQASVQKIFGEVFREQFGLQDLYSASSTSFAVTGNRAYQLMSSGDIYSFDLEDGAYSLYTHVPALPALGYSVEMRYSDLDDGIKALVDGAVFQIIGRIDGDELYGYCPTSGRIGRIDEEGVHWNEIRLDNSLQMKSDPAYPEDLLYARILGEALYAFHDRAENEDAPCEGQILKFDLETGDCQATDIPGAYALCCAPSAEALLLCRDDEGNISLRRYNLLTEVMDDSTEPLPILRAQAGAKDWYSVTTLLSGLAWSEDHGGICFATPDGLWQWAADDGEPNRVSLDGSAWEELSAHSEAWFSEGGAYVLKNGEKYVVSLE